VIIGCLSSDETLFLKRTNGLGADFHRNLVAIDDYGLGLEVWLPDFLGVALGEADIVAELLALASEFTLLHSG
jgi:hypothetical protein